MATVGWVVSSENTSRMASFAIVLTTMAVWELAAGRRELVTGRGQRWLTNLTLLVLGIGVVRVADLGYPTSVSIDYIENAIDDEVAFTVSSFQLLDASGN